MNTKEQEPRLDAKTRKIAEIEKVINHVVLKEKRKEKLSEKEKDHASC